MATAFSKIWSTRKQIIEGIANTIVKKKFVEDVAAYRKEICDQCEYNNGDCLVPGTGPCCGACGCSLKFKLRSMSAVCGLIDKDKQPKWFPVMTVKEDDKHFGDLDNV